LINHNDTEIKEKIKKMKRSEVKSQLLQMISQPNINIQEMLSNEYYSFLMRSKQERDKQKASEFQRNNPGLIKPCGKLLNGKK